MASRKAAKVEHETISKAIRIKPLNRKGSKLTIQGITPLISNRKPADPIIRAEPGGLREKLSPEEQYKRTLHELGGNRYGFPLSGIKKSVVSSANYRLLGISETTLKRSIFFASPDGDSTYALIKGSPKMRRDLVTVGRGGKQDRYRAMFDPWEIALLVEYDADLITIETIFNMVERAGYGIGIGDWRPEKNGDFGRFQVKR